MTLITERLIGGVRRLLGPKRNSEPTKPQMRELLPPRKLVQRRFLPMRNGPTAEAVWIDDDGHEREHHRTDDRGAIIWGKWHRFEDAQGRLWAIRCPATLEESEKLRVMADLPEGSMRTLLADYGKDRDKPSKYEWNP